MYKIVLDRLEIVDHVIQKLCFNVIQNSSYEGNNSCRNVTVIEYFTSEWDILILWLSC